MKTISFVALGCRTNQAENSEYIQSMLEAGWEVLDPSVHSSEVYVINTCTVTNEAERQSRQLIRKFARKNPNSKIIVTGCSGKYLEHNKEISSIVSLFIPNIEKSHLVERLYKFLGIEKEFNSPDSIPPVEESETTRLNLKISDGCNWSCSYCIIPRVRGKLRSLTEDEVIAKTKRAEEMGYKEIILTAIQLGGYGKDFGKNGLESLIPRLLSETGISRIRLSSVEPTDVSDKLIEELSKSDRICNQFHIPVQSGSDHILELMKRKYSRKEFADRINTIRKYIPDATLTTDILIGFPGERDIDFQDSCEFVQELNFNKLHIFPYSDRSGTASSKMIDKVDHDTIKLRKKILSEIDKKLQNNWFNDAIGKKKQVLVEETKDESGYVNGTSKDYYKVYFQSEAHKKNDLADVLITGFNPEKQCLLGKIE